MPVPDQDLDFKCHYGVFFCVKKFNQYQQNEKNTSPQIIEEKKPKRPCNIGMEIQVLV
jgi:hypothetical protein